MRRRTMAACAMTATPLARLVVDRRELASGVPRLLAECPWAAVAVSELRSGDYALGDALGIERKTALDRARSLVDGRLFLQVGGLRRRYRRQLLLVEGLADGTDVLGVAWPAMRGALISVSVCFGIPVLRSLDVVESAELILTAIRQLREPIGNPYVRPGFRPRGWRRRALFILQGLPSVGPQRAIGLLSRFGSVAAVASADAAALSDVPGVGPAVARSIREALGPAPASPTWLGTGRAPRPHRRDPDKA